LLTYAWRQELYLRNIQNYDDCSATHMLNVTMKYLNILLNHINGTFRKGSNNKIRFSGEYGLQPEIRCNI